MWSKAVFRVIPKNAENPQTPVCQWVPAFWLRQVGWMPIRSQTMRRELYCTWKKQENSCRLRARFLHRDARSFPNKGIITDKLRKSKRWKRGICFSANSGFTAVWIFAIMQKTSADKGTRACGPDWAAVCCVIALDLRRQVPRSFSRRINGGWQGRRDRRAVARQQG